MTPSFRKYNAYADIREGSSGTDSEVVDPTTAIFGDLDGYFFGNVRDKASNITGRHATPCRPVIDCKVNDLEWLFHVKIRFRPARVSDVYLFYSASA